MFTVKPFGYAVAAAMLASSAAFALDQTGTASTATQTATKDFGKLSADGQKAFRNVHMARLAIFDGHPAQAKTEIDQARAAMKSAQTDDTIFVKAESDLKPPAGMAAPSTAKTAPGTTPVKWLPVDGSMALGEDYVATPAKATAVAKANDQIKKGDHKHAAETLKLADVDVTFVTSVAPLEASTGKIDKAATLIDAGKYYQANQELKSVEDGVRYDVADFNDVAKKSKTAATAPQAAPTQSSASSSSTTNAQAVAK